MSSFNEIADIYTKLEFEDCKEKQVNKKKNTEETWEWPKREPLDDKESEVWVMRVLITTAIVIFFHPQMSSSSSVHSCDDHLNL